MHAARELYIKSADSFTTEVVDHSVYIGWELKLSHRVTPVLRKQCKSVPDSAKCEDFNDTFCTFLTTKLSLLICKM